MHLWILVKINEDEQDNNTNKKNDIPNFKKTYKSKRFKNIDEQNEQNSNGLNSARFKVSKKDLFNNNLKEDKNKDKDKDKNNNENIIFPNYQKAKSSYELFKKFSKRKK